MHSFSYITLFAAAASAAYLPGADKDLETRAACPPVQIVAAPGEGTVAGDLSLLQSTVDAIMGVAPDAGLFQVAYPAGADDAAAIAAGTPIFLQHVESFAAQCPDSKMVTVGYSAGAAIVMDNLCGDARTGAGSLATDYRHNIVANIIYGDPTYTTGRAYNAGTCTTSDGEVPRAKPGLCYPFGRKTKSYCDEGDQVCCGGTDEAVHFTYPATYDTDAANWVRAKLTYWRRHRNETSA